MSAISVKQFVEHIMKSKQFREKYSADVLLDFFNYTNKKKFPVAYHYRLKYLLDEICTDNTTFSKEFYDDLINELDELKNKKKDDKIIRDAQFSMWSVCISNNNIMQYYHYLVNKYEINREVVRYNGVEVIRLDEIQKLWTYMNKEERSLWIKPSNQGNPYTKWITIYKNKVLEVYPNTKDKQLYSLMGSIWTSIKGNIKYAELREYTYEAPYIEYTDDEKILAHNLNSYLIKELMDTHRKALETMKKYIHMKRFIKLCKSEEFNKYFWDPKNMGGKWHINKMKKMCSEL
jgi:hypothetical protein